MLYLLSVILTVSLLLNPASAMAGFFGEKDTTTQESACSECKSEPLNLNPDLKEKVAEIERTISNNLNKKENTHGNEVTLFIDLANNSSEAAVNALVKFKKDNPSWMVRGVIIGNHKNLKQKLLQKQKFFNNSIEFSIDLSGSLAKEFNILKTPVYIITFSGKHHKITGLADLNDAISKLDK